MSPPRRSARIVIVGEDGALLGVLPPTPVSTPWWQDIAPVVEAVQARFGVTVTILRLLEAERSAPPGGEVTYLAQSGVPPPGLAPWDGRLDDHPLRLPYARPGGPAADVGWATARLAERGVSLRAPATQIRTWNLSSLWRLDCGHSAAWLKVVPPFFAHEGALLAHLAGKAVPRLLARDGPRILLAEIAGEDLYEAAPKQLAAMLDMLVEIQNRQVSQLDALLALGLPDWRLSALSDAVATLVARRGDDLDAGDRRGLHRFLSGLGRRAAAIATCGLPDTLVHGDFHSGNFRGEGLNLTLLDWGDSGVGHPLLDQAAFVDRIAPQHRAPMAEHWRRRWLEAAPGSDPARAARLLAPLAAARQALIYQGFLDRIEPSEHPYHRDDPADWLGRAAALARAEADPP